MTAITAQPFDFPLDLARCALLIIDMQRDFVEPGGFGASLGNDVTRLQAIVPTCAGVMTTWRLVGGCVVHAREGHKPDLSDCPPAKLSRGSPSLRIGDLGPMGRVLVIGQPGHAIVPALAPLRVSWSSTSWQGGVLQHPAAGRAAGARHPAIGDHGRDHRGLRADHDARGQ